MRLPVHGVISPELPLSALFGRGGLWGRSLLSVDLIGAVGPGTALRSRACVTGLLLAGVVLYSTEDDDDDDSNADVVEEVVVVIVVVVVVVEVVIVVLQLVELSERALRKHAALAGLTLVLLAAVNLLLVSSSGLLATLVVPWLVLVVGQLLLLAASKLLFLSLAGMLFTLLMSTDVGEVLLRILLGLGVSDGDLDGIIRSKLLGL